MASKTGSEVELRPVSSPFEHRGNDGCSAEWEAENQGQPVMMQASLPPVDSGKEAWLFLAGSFFIEALVWGKYSSDLGFAKPFHYIH